MSRIEKLQNFLTESPSDCFVMHALGLEYIKIGDDSSALKMFQEVIQMDPNYVGTYYHLGKLLESQKQENRAMEIYRQGIDIATKLEDKHAKSELETALWELED